MRSLRIAGLTALTLLTATVLHAQEPLVVGERHRLTSKVLGEERQIVVWTAGAYGFGRTAFPVLYLTDAEQQFFHTVATVEFLSRNGRIPAFIVVGVLNTDRTRDLTPYPTSDEETRARTPTAGGGDRFLEFFESELIPWVESNYRTQPFRVFAGHSFGGLFAAHALAARPDLFNALIAVSPTLQWNGGEPVRRIEALLADRRELRRTLLVTIGDEGPGIQSGFDALKRLLERRSAKGFRWEAIQMPEEDHGSIVLRSHYLALEKIFEGWRIPPDERTEIIRKGPAAVERHYARVSERLGWRIVPPEAQVNALGYAALAPGDASAAIAFFELNVANYEDSPNVYDSLGEGLEAAGQLTDALARYEEAVRRGEASKDPALDVYREHRDRLRARLSQ